MVIKGEDFCKLNLSVIGLGYVGLPLAIKFASVKNESKDNFLNQVIGFDINKSRVSYLEKGIDKNKEVSNLEFEEANNIIFTSNEKYLITADIFIITVPTPIDKYKNPNLTPLKESSASVGKALKERKKIVDKCLPIIIYESTVFPGATEEVCIPIIEEFSGLQGGRDFYFGYSPERINPGDKEHKISDIVKVTSGCCQNSALTINNLYSKIIRAGTYMAKSIKVAEAAKVIENTQRDINIALMNELAIIFSKIGIDTNDVIDAASTKWNFLKFKPGLVGGHCIGVDPYYLTHKSHELGYNPQIILAGRRINDSIAEWMVERLVLEMCKKNIIINNANALVMGITFKENCPDLRNTKVLDVIKALKKYGMQLTIVDPNVDTDESSKQHGYKVDKYIPKDIKYDVIILAVAHKEFLSLTKKSWLDLAQKNSIFLDFKGVIPRELNTVRL